MRPRLLLRAAKWLAALVIIPTVLFLLSAWIGAAIPRNNSWQEPPAADGDSVTLLIGSNGVHTEIVMPVTQRASETTLDWREHFPLSDLGASDRDYTHVAVSWGERAFFLETPTWAEFDVVNAVSALWGGDALLHASYRVRARPSESHREFKVRPEEYRALAEMIIADLAPMDQREVYPGYGASDVFYSASGAYHLGNTCNQWTSDRLARAGVRTGWWTPLPGGVMQWVEED